MVDLCTCNTMLLSTAQENEVHLMLKKDFKGNMSQSTFKGFYV